MNTLLECSCPFECGSIKNISFPFWGGNRPVYCGHEGFELECHNSQYFVIKFEALEFRVPNINQSRHIRTIARSDLWDSPCPQKFFNTTLVFTIFDYYASTLRNLTMFYDCPAQLNRSVQNWLRSGFGVGDTNNTAYFVDESVFQYFRLTILLSSLWVELWRDFRKYWIKGLMSITNTMPCRLSVGSVRNQVGNAVQSLHKHFSAFAVTMCDILTVQVTVCKLSSLLSTHIH